MTLGVSTIDVNGLVQEIEERHDGRGMCDEVEGIITLRVANSGIRIVCNKQLDYVEISIACCPLHWSGDKITTKSIHLCALF